MTFKKLALYLEKLEATSSRLKITAILSTILKEATAEEVDKLCYLILGYLAPPYQGIEFSLAEKMMVRAVSRAFKREEKEMMKLYKERGDLGLVTEEISRSCPDFFKKSFLSVSQVYERLLEIAQEGGEGSQERKISKMAALIAAVDPLSGRFLVRIPLGRLRLGFSEITLLDALSWMISGDKRHRSQIEEAYNVRADIGFIARVIKEKGLSALKKVTLSLGTPIMPALCQRLPTPEEMIKKMCSGSDDMVAVEPKYDGSRLEVHFRRRPALAAMFTRNLENVAPMFPDIARALPQEVKATSIVFDGEVVGYDPQTGRLLSFQKTIKRKRKHGVKETLLTIPLRYYCFDVLYYNGQALINRPFSFRRQILEKVLSPKNKTVLLSPQMVTRDPEEIRKYHDEQIKKGLEGVVVKKWQAYYDVGKRGFTWVKFKEEGGRGRLSDSVDGVVMGYYRGRGRRASLGIGAFLLGIRGKGGEFLTVSKIGTGLTDEQWRQMKRYIDDKKISRKPAAYRVNKNLFPDVWCSPSIVVEIEADNITRSPVHTAGLALRFPRLIRFRHDKSAEEATTIEELKKLKTISEKVTA